MTLFHFGNCFALAYFPYFITYKCSGLSEYSAFWRCVQAGATYVLVQLGKMLFLATFFPTWEGPSGGYDLVGEFLRATVDAADLGGLQLALGRGGGAGGTSHPRGRPGLGQRRAPHVPMGLDSNISLARHVAAAALLWASGRHDLPPRLRLPLGGLLAAAAYEGFLTGWAGQALGLGPWGALGLRALGAAALGLGALRLLVPLLPPP
ncbi:transmembrane protein 147 [Grus japonensis]|uniref:BOS complex subunit TMEM147 n=1 Tax=Grus japonensis TaxID=30415 RepID=A0ABC9XSV1_GRUJA